MKAHSNNYIKSLLLLVLLTNGLGANADDDKIVDIPPAAITFLHEPSPKPGASFPDKTAQVQASSPQLITKGGKTVLQVTTYTPSADGTSTPQQTTLELGAANARALEKVLAAKNGSAVYSVPDDDVPDSRFLRITGKLSITIGSKGVVKRIDIEVEDPLISDKPKNIPIQKLRDTLQVRTENKAPRPIQLIDENGKNIGRGAYLPPRIKGEAPLVINHASDFGVQFFELSHPLREKFWAPDKKIQMQFGRAGAADNVYIYSTPLNVPAGTKASSTHLATVKASVSDFAPSTGGRYYNRAIQDLSKIPLGATRYPVIADVFVERGYDDHEIMGTKSNKTDPFLYRDINGNLILRYLMPGKEDVQEIKLSDHDAKLLSPYLQAGHHLDEPDGEVWINTGRGMMKFDNLLEFTLTEDGKLKFLRSRFWSATIPDGERKEGENIVRTRTKEMLDSARYFNARRVAPFIEVRDDRHAAVPVTILTNNGLKLPGLILRSPQDPHKALLKVSWASAKSGQEELTYLIGGENVDAALQVNRFTSKPIEILMLSRNTVDKIRNSGESWDVVQRSEFQDHGIHPGHSISGRGIAPETLSLKKSAGLWTWQKDAQGRVLPKPKNLPISGDNRIWPDDDGRSSREDGADFPDTPPSSSDCPKWLRRFDLGDDSTQN